MMHASRWFCWACWLAPLLTAKQAVSLAVPSSVEALLTPQARGCGWHERAVAALKELSTVPALDEETTAAARLLAHEVSAACSSAKAPVLPATTLFDLGLACRRLGLPDSATQLQPHGLPFEVFPGLLLGKETPPLTLAEVQEEVVFRKDQLVTRSGRLVNERRLTCWMADEGIGGFAYSGKIMAPEPFSPGVKRLRDWLYQNLGTWYDCGLLNWYPDGDSACAWHSDPEHGDLWAPASMIVSLGATRRFSFRESPTTKGKDRTHDGTTFSFLTCDGDGIAMYGDCQDRFQHCVHRDDTCCHPRASIVFKTSLPRSNGSRGHGPSSKPTGGARRHSVRRGAASGRRAPKGKRAIRGGGHGGRAGHDNGRTRR